MNDEIKTLVIDDTSYETKHTAKFERRKPYTAADPKRMLSIIPGLIVEIQAREGQQVRWGQQLLVLEAMKMNNSVCSPLDGTIKRIHVQTGVRVQKHQLLIEFE